jgi:hypothetical protein
MTSTARDAVTRAETVAVIQTRLGMLSQLSWVTVTLLIIILQIAASSPTYLLHSKWYNVLHISAPALRGLPPRESQFAFQPPCPCPHP